MIPKRTSKPTNAPYACAAVLKSIYHIGPDRRYGTAALFRCFRVGMKKEINMRLNAIAATLACALLSAAAASSAYAQYYYGPVFGGKADMCCAS